MFELSDFVMVVVKKRWEVVLETLTRKEPNSVEEQVQIAHVRAAHKAITDADVKSKTAEAKREADA